MKPLASIAVVTALALALASSDVPPNPVQASPQFAAASGPPPVLEQPAVTHEVAQVAGQRYEEPKPLTELQFAQFQSDLLRKQRDEARATIAERDATIADLREQLARQTSVQPERFTDSSPIAQAPARAVAQPTRYYYAPRAPVAYYGSCAGGSCGPAYSSGRFRLFGRR